VGERGAEGGVVKKIAMGDVATAASRSTVMHLQKHNNAGAISLLVESSHNVLVV
jgi:hypothetical protein